MFRLDGKVAVVTGGFRGLGRAMAVSLAKSGALVVAADVLPEDVGQDTLKAVQEVGGKAELIRLDVTQSDSADDAIRDVHKRLGRLDILVNNAGISRDNLLLRDGHGSLPIARAVARQAMTTAHERLAFRHIVRL